MERAAVRFLGWCASRRRRQLERTWRDVARVQEAALLNLVAAARDTEFGLVHGLSGVRSVADYQSRVPGHGIVTASSSSRNR